MRVVTVPYFQVMKDRQAARPFARLWGVHLLYIGAEGNPARVGLSMESHLTIVDPEMHHCVQQPRFTIGVIRTEHLIFTNVMRSFPHQGRWSNSHRKVCG